MDPRIRAIYYLFFGIIPETDGEAWEIIYGHASLLLGRVDKITKKQIALGILECIKR